MLWTTSSVWGKIIWTFLVSMVPVMELRAGLPIGITSGLPFPVAYCTAVLGNMLPVPFIIVFIRKVFIWLRANWAWMNNVVTALEERASDKSAVIDKYGKWGLLLFVAIPAPGTGAWTGALIAALLNMRVRQAVPVIFVGVCIAGLIMSAVTFGVIHLF